MAKRGLATFACLLLLGLAALFGAGEYLSSPARRAIGAAPPGFPASSVAIASAAGPVQGWMARGTPGAGVVLLLHGVRGNRLQMLGRARFLTGLGYGVLLIDQQAHGESAGKRIGFGVREADGVRAALAYLKREQPGERSGVIGMSLGAAALVLSRPGREIDALVIEAMYPTIEEAIENRLRLHLGSAGGALAPLLLWQLPLRLDLTLEQLRPIDAAGALACPTLVVGGEFDKHTSELETRRIYAAVPEPKQLWIVPGAAHTDFHGFATREYETRIGNFMALHLRGFVPSKQ
ncbi:alpha/beta hydrolase [Massilia atriviolacea]|uniref:Alpha/beta hydrolase n=1 Tax=Massilia atriviolacea TaxID=2495579 RepID=A0A430HM98_9BURK|nr:alpha/beta hydrolase [Massilia atriviolacea]RSZ58655.1 alpha/beta hydrolase [Massilia atriviolacea]